MELAENEQQQLESLISKIGVELALAQPGSDDGLIPVYSLLNEVEGMLADHLEHPLAVAVKDALSALGVLLDHAKPFDEETLGFIGKLASWAQDNWESLAKGEAVEPAPQLSDVFETAKEEKAEPQNEQAQANASGAPQDALLVIDLKNDLEVLQEFRTEATEHLEQIEDALLTLEHDPKNKDSLDAVFRSFHTIKGVAGFLRLLPMQSLAHEVESLLDYARNGELTLSSGIITLVLTSKDTLQEFLEQISLALDKGKLPQEIIPVADLIQKVKNAAVKGLAGQMVEVAELEQTPVSGAPEKRSSQSASLSVRVDTQKLDNLMDMVGELVILQSQLQQSSSHEAAGDDSPLQRNFGQLARITKDLQLTSMSLRMVPVKPTFQKMGRVVRDLAQELNKKATFHPVGEDTELDRNVIERIGDPLVHMVRNAVDHGIESPEERINAGKTAEGNFYLKAYHQGSNIVIEIEDDGRGIDPDKILAKAQEKGLVPPDKEFKKQEILQFIFMPGFSTAAKVTDVSGRGVGMDVVRKNIEQLRGTVEIDSEVGEGSVFKIKLPLTMAIIDGLIVSVGQERFIVPAISVRSTMKAEDYQVSTVQGKVELLDLGPEGTLPIVHLNQRFGVETDVQQVTDGIIVIVETALRNYALLVDRVLGKQEVVIKGLGPMLQKIQGVAGGAILGDGQISLIIDPASLVKDF